MTSIEQAARQIFQSWQQHKTLDDLAGPLSPESLAQGYEVQHALAELRNEKVVGWKIAATSQAGQLHINVDQPLAGRLYESVVHRDGESIEYQHNRMQVAEAEIVLTLGSDLPARAQPYTTQEVAAAVCSVSAGLELPDSRFVDFTSVGAACLAADNACASQFVLGEISHSPVLTEALLNRLANHPTRLLVNEVEATHGFGRDALGGPLAALTWLANQLGTIGADLYAGQFVTTGVTGKPSAVRVGNAVVADLGCWGTVGVQLI